MSDADCILSIPLTSCISPNYDIDVNLRIFHDHLDIFAVVSGLTHFEINVASWKLQSPENGLSVNNCALNQVQVHETWITRIYSYISFHNVGDRLINSVHKLRVILKDTSKSHNYWMWNRKVAWFTRLRKSGVFISILDKLVGYFG